MFTSFCLFFSDFKSFLLLKGETNLDAWALKLSENQNVVWVVTSANGGQETYLQNFRVDGAEITDEPHPLAGLCC